jgi:hypothetical protein
MPQLPTPVAMLLAALFMHTTCYLAQVLQQRFCHPSYIQSFFMSGSTACQTLRHVSDASRDGMPILMSSIAMLIGTLLRHPAAVRLRI